MLIYHPLCYAIFLVFLAGTVLALTPCLFCLSLSTTCYYLLLFLYVSLFGKTACGRSSGSRFCETIATSGAAPMRRPCGRAGGEGGKAGPGPRGCDRAFHGGLYQRDAAVEVQ